ncbi:MULTISPECIES: ParB N-terminal domain-containing protein [unclassified Isoptericola]|uniref:ParB N-terminal domain-containing protein n=1 Tax=unclassified Isoptericola TaxID=2623355 RepID=UPI0036506AF7
MREAKDYLGAERSVSSITVGIRHRSELGDLSALMASIERVGLLQPITVTPDGVLVCGRRRLEAIIRLGWTSVKVWVRAGISDPLSGLLAQQDENALHKPLAPTEAARLYRELKAVLAEDARRRQEASRFGTDGDVGEENGGGDSPPPRNDHTRSRARAAHMVTGSESYQRLEQISRIQNVIDDESYPLEVRRLAESELDKINDGGPVDPAYRTVIEAVALSSAAPRSADEPCLDDEPTPEEIAELSTKAFARAKEERKRRVELLSSHRTPPTPVKRSVTALVMSWADLDGWTQHYDPAEVAAKLSDSDWAMLERTVAESTRFVDLVRAARAGAA